MLDFNCAALAVRGAGHDADRLRTVSEDAEASEEAEESTSWGPGRTGFFSPSGLELPPSYAPWRASEVKVRVFSGLSGSPSVIPSRPIDRQPR